MTTPSERFRRSLTSDNLWLYVITLLKKDKMYAYDINKKIAKTFGFTPGNMTAYIVLKRLQMGGYVKAARTEKSSGPERKYYTITEKGKMELEKARKLYKKMTKFF